MRESREYDVVVWGATGFTGRLVAEHLLQRHGTAGELRWAVAGRNPDKLDCLKRELNAGDVPAVIADAGDRASLEAMARRTRVVLTTVGPYSLYGSSLIAACAATGTDYCDLSGEVPWMRRMLDEYGEQAAASGARLVHCCGFDSIPSDLGVLLLQSEARRQYGRPLSRVKMRVRAARGGFSGGTYASLLAISEQARHDKKDAAVLKDPYALCPPERRGGIRQPHVSGARFDAEFDAWIAPFIMAPINTRIVQRSNALAGENHVPDLRYDEALLTGGGLAGRLRASGITIGMGAFLSAAAWAPTRALLKRFVLPEAGQGPSREQREQGFFKLLLHGATDDGRVLWASVSGDRDPGYGATSRMIGEAAAMLSRLPGERLAGGFWTPATAFGLPLIERLEQHAGMRFSLDRPRQSNELL